MATPITIVDGTSEFEAAVVNKFIASDGSKVNVKNYHASIRHVDGDFEVNAGIDSSGIVTADLFFNTGTDLLEITISGFVNPPTVLVSSAVGSTYFVKASASSNTLVTVGFYSAMATLVGTPDDFMSCSIIIQGY